MSPLETPNHVERLVRRLVIIHADLGRLNTRLRYRERWDDEHLEDLRTSITLLQQVEELLGRVARRWRRGDDQ